MSHSEQSKSHSEHPKKGADQEKYSKLSYKPDRKLWIWSVVAIALIIVLIWVYAKKVSGPKKACSSLLSKKYTKIYAYILLDSRCPAYQKSLENNIFFVQLFFYILSSIFVLVLCAAGIFLPVVNKADLRIAKEIIVMKRRKEGCIVL